MAEILNATRTAKQQHLTSISDPFWSNYESLRSTDLQETFLNKAWVIEEFNKQAFKRNTYYEYFYGNIKSKDPFAIFKKILELFPNVTLKSNAYNSEGLVVSCFVGDDTYIILDIEIENRWGICIVSFDKNTYLKFNELVSSFKDDKKSQLKILIENRGSLYFHDVEFVTKELERDNYTEETLASIDHAVADLNSPDPCGRIVLLDGPPGTGKSMAIRSIPGLVPNGVFINIPSGMVAQLAQPTFISLLLSEKPENGPLVLIIEDADESISDREKGNTQVLSTILNMSDGLLGAVLDIRILASTNAEIEELDEAVIRPGRLCQRIEMGLLNSEKANSVYKRLTGKEGPFAENKLISLAEVYLEASGKKPDSTARLKRPNKKLGFGK